MLLFYFVLPRGSKREIFEEKPPLLCGSPSFLPDLHPVHVSEDRRNSNGGNSNGREKAAACGKMCRGKKVEDPHGGAPFSRRPASPRRKSCGRHSARRTTHPRRSSNKKGTLLAFSSRNPHLRSVCFPRNSFPHFYASLLRMCTPHFPRFTLPLRRVTLRRLNRWIPSFSRLLVNTQVGIRGSS